MHDIDLSAHITSRIVPTPLNNIPEHGHVYLWDDSMSSLCKPLSCMRFSMAGMQTYTVEMLELVHEICICIHLHHSLPSGPGHLAIVQHSSLVHITHISHPTGPTSDAGVRCGSVQGPFLLNHAPNHRAGSKHVPNRALHCPTPVRGGAEWFGVWCTGFEPGPIGQKKGFLNVVADLPVHPDRTYFVTSSKDKTARVC